MQSCGPPGTEFETTVRRASDKTRELEEKSRAAEARQ